LWLILLLLTRLLHAKRNRFARIRFWPSWRDLA
jgi:hypothetical protein